jgi:predicted DNA-binding protein (UPF0251 family)
MPRPRKHRCCRRFAADRVFKPQGIPMSEIDQVLLTLDQFEAMRLCDHEDLEQEEAGAKMGVSRGTVQRLLYSGRKAVVEAVLQNKALIVNPKESEVCHVGMHSHPGKCRNRRPCQ